MKNGRYRAKGIEGALGFTSGNKEQVAVLFELLEGEYAGVRMTWHGFFTDKTTKRTIEALRNCGWEGNDLTNLGGINRNEVELVIENEEYEGKTRPKVQWVNAIGRIALSATMPVDQAKAFALRMKGLVVKTTQEMAEPKQPSAGPTTPSAAPKQQDAFAAGEDDIPF